MGTLFPQEPPSGDGVRPSGRELTATDPRTRLERPRKQRQQFPPRRACPPSSCAVINPRRGRLQRSPLMIYLVTTWVTAAGIPGTWTSRGLDPGTDFGRDGTVQYWVDVAEPEMAIHVMLLCVMDLYRASGVYPGWPRQTPPSAARVCGRADTAPVCCGTLSPIGVSPGGLKEGEAPRSETTAPKAVGDSATVEAPCRLSGQPRVPFYSKRRGFPLGLEKMRQPAKQRHLRNAAHGRLSVPRGKKI